MESGIYTKGKNAGRAGMIDNSIFKNFLHLLHLNIKYPYLAKTCRRELGKAMAAQENIFFCKNHTEAAVVARLLRRQAEIPSLQNRYNVPPVKAGTLLSFSAAGPASFFRGGARFCVSVPPVKYIHTRLSEYFGPLCRSWY